MAERFDKFTQRARHVLSMAHQEAGNFGQTGIDTEHVLLGLIDEGEGIAARVLVALCGTLPPIRKAVVDRIEQSRGTFSDEIGLTPRAKKLIELAVDEARRLNHHYIGTEHLLLALTRIEEGIAADVLREFGINHNQAVAQVIATITSGGNPSPTTDAGSHFGQGIGMPPWIRARWEQHRQQRQGGGGQRPFDQQPTPPIDFKLFTEPARRVLTFSQEEAQRFNHNYIGTEHLLLGLVREEDGIAAQVLRSFGLDLGDVRRATEFIIGRGGTMIMGEIGLTPRAKTVLALAVDEAHRLHHRYIGTEHLLLGIVREGEGIAAGVLESQGVALEALRARILQALFDPTDNNPIRRPPSAATTRPLRPRPMPTPRPPLSPEEMELLRTPRGDLRQVIPIVQKQTRENTTLVGVAIERYENLFVARWLISVTNVERHPHPHFEAEAMDDRGTRYRALPGGSSGGGSPGGPFEGHFSFRFLPALDPAASSLTLTLTLPERPIPDVDPGPWRFTVAISPLPEA